MMDTKIFLLCLVIGTGILISRTNAEDKAKDLRKREAEVRESKELEQELKRVKRIQNNGDMFDRVELGANPASDPVLSRVKRIKRSLQHVKDALEEVKKKPKFQEKAYKGRERIFLEKRLHRLKRIERRGGVHSHGTEHRPLKDGKLRASSKTKLDLDHLLSRKEGIKEMMKHTKLLNNKTEIKEMKHKKVLKPKSKIWSLVKKHKNKMNKIGKSVNS